MQGRQGNRAMLRLNIILQIYPGSLLELRTWSASSICKLYILLSNILCGPENILASYLR